MQLFQRIFKKPAKEFKILIRYYEMNGIGPKAFTNTVEAATVSDAVYMCATANDIDTDKVSFNNLGLKNGIYCYELMQIAE